MAELVADCPRCGSESITFDVTAAHIIGTYWGWQNQYEAFSICRKCHHATIFVVEESVDGDHEYVHKTGLLNIKSALNNFVTIEEHVSLKHEARVSPPEHIPDAIADAFREGATCFAVGCYNAAGTMFRLCIDLATKSMLPEGEIEGLKWKTRRDLASDCHGCLTMGNSMNHSEDCPPASRMMGTTVLTPAP